MRRCIFLVAQNSTFYLGGMPKSKDMFSMRRQCTKSVIVRKLQLFQQMNEKSSTAWVYHSNVNQGMDIDSGLVGTIIITKKGYANETGMPLKVDRNYIISLSIINENDSLYTDFNIATFCPKVVGNLAVLTTFNWFLSNLKHSVNGRMFNNLHGLIMYTGEHIRWYTFTQGSEFDFHSGHWHAQTVITNRGKRLDVLYIFPNYIVVADMVPDDSGIWIYHCHVDSHVSAGMITNFTVMPTTEFYANGRNFATLYDAMADLFGPSDEFYNPKPDDIPLYTLSVFDPFDSANSLVPCVFSLVILCLFYIIL